MQSVEHPAAASEPRMAPPGASPSQLISFAIEFENGGESMSAVAYHILREAQDQLRRLGL